MSTQLDTTNLIGKSEVDAVKEIEAAGLTANISGRDGRMFPRQMNMAMNRVQLYIEDGKVETARIA